jgi:hypothetical protein
MILMQSELCFFFLCVCVFQYCALTTHTTKIEKLFDSTRRNVCCFREFQVYRGKYSRTLL